MLIWQASKAKCFGGRGLLTSRLYAAVAQERRRNRMTACLRIVSVGLMVALLACTNPSDSSKEQRLERHRRDPVRTIAAWGTQWRNRPLADRVAAAPPALLQYLHEENSLEGFSESPRSAEPSALFSTALAQLLALLPAQVRTLLEERCIGLFLVDDLGGSGFAELISDASGNDSYGLLVLDRGVLLSRRANEWASWKDGSAFAPARSGTSTRVQIEIEDGASDTVENAIEFILLHELGHLASFFTHAVPSYNVADAGSDFPFVQRSWRYQGGKHPWASRSAEAFPEQEKLHYYTFDKAELGNDQIVPAYTHLRDATNFTSMPAAATHLEDFAESFATYVHCVIAHRPYRIIITPPSGAGLRIERLWDDPRRAQKRAFMQAWMEHPG
jgi:hypothetical protein